MTKKETKKIEREYIIPLREKCRPVPRYKKTPKAIKTIKEFVARHMKVYDRDLNKIKIDRFLNEEIWRRGIKKPLHKVKVKVVKEGEIVRVYPLNLSSRTNFRKLREERIESKAKEDIKKKKSLMDKAKEQISPGKAPEENSEEKAEEKSKPEQKEAQKQVKEEKKHTTKVKSPSQIKASEKKKSEISKGK